MSATPSNNIHLVDTDPAAGPNAFILENHVFPRITSIFQKYTYDYATKTLDISAILVLLYQLYPNTKSIKSLIEILSSNNGTMSYISCARNFANDNPIPFSQLSLRLQNACNAIADDFKISHPIWPDQFTIIPDDLISLTGNKPKKHSFRNFFKNF